MTPMLPLAPPLVFRVCVLKCTLLQSFCIEAIDSPLEVFKFRRPGTDTC